MKDPTGPFNRKKLLAFLEKKAKEEKDWENVIAFVKKEPGVYIFAGFIRDKLSQLFSSSVNSFFNMHAQHPLGLDVWFLVGPFVYFHTSCVRTAKAQPSLHKCAGSPEPSLVAYVISTIISWAGSVVARSLWVLDYSVSYHIWFKSWAMQGDTMSSGRIHVQRSFRKFACALNKFWLVESWFLETWSSGSRYIAQRNANEQQPFTVWCICCHWTMYPKINFQPIRTCWMHAQIRRMNEKYVSFHWTCIALHSVQWLAGL